MRQREDAQNDDQHTAHRITRLERGTAVSEREDTRGQPQSHHHVGKVRPSWCHMLHLHTDRRRLGTLHGLAARH